MKYLFRKLFRDVLKLWPQFVSVFMMAFLAMTIYSGMEGVWYGLSTTANDYYKETNLCDAWLYGNMISQEQWNQLQNLEDVKCISRSMTFGCTMPDLDDESSLKIITVGSTDTMSPKQIDGNAFQTNQNGIWLDASFADAHEIQPGDTFPLTFLGKEYTLTVQGTILHSEFIYYTGSQDEIIPDSYRYGYAIISEQQAKQLFGALTYNEIRIKMSDNSNFDSLRQKVKEILGSHYQFMLEREDLDSVYQVKKEASQMHTLSKAYCTVFILLSILTMYTTMRRLVNNQRILIGTLKALGFTNLQLRIHYSLYGAVVSLAGGLCGSFFGRATISRAIMEVKKNVLTLPVWHIRVSLMSYIVIIGITLICTVAAETAAGKILRGTPAQTMHGLSPEKKFKKQSTRNSFSRFSNGWRWVLRDISRNKVRYLMGLTGVAGSMTLMIAGFGIRTSLDYSNHYVYEKQYTYDYKVKLAAYDSAVRDSIEKDYPSIQWICEKSGFLSLSDTEETGIITIVDYGTYICLENTDGTKITLPDQGAVITKKLAASLNAHVGDYISLTLPGNTNPVSVKITAIAISPAPQGLFLSSVAFTRLGYDFVPNAVLIEENKTQDKIMENTLFTEVLSREAQMEDIRKMSESINTIIFLLILASLLLLTVILYNLGMLGYVERFREYATLKVLGFYQKEIRSLGLRDTLMTTVPGWIIGGFCGFRFLHFLTGIVSYKTFEWIPKLTLFCFLLITLITFFLSFGIDILIHNRVKKINMVEALKSVD